MEHRDYSDLVDMEFWSEAPAETRAKAAPNVLARIGVQGKAKPLGTDLVSAVQALDRNEIAAACLRTKQDAMIDPRLMIQERTEDGTWREVPGHPLRRILMRPTDDEDGATFMGYVVASWDIARKLYIQKLRSASGALVGLNVLNPLLVKPYHNARGDREGYEWRDGQVFMRFKDSDLIIRETRAWAGQAPLRSALGAIDLDTAQTDFVRAFFDNGGQPSGIIKVKGKYTQEKADELGGRWATKYGRRGNGWGRPAVLDETADYQKVGSGLDELDSETVRSLAESRICMSFGVPPLIIYAYVGLLRATYSNLEEAWASFWDTMSAHLRSWSLFFTRALLPEFVGQNAVDNERYRLEWDFSKVAYLQDDVDQIHERALKSWNAGTITLNEYRALIGQPPDPAGEYYLRPSGKVAVPFGQPLIAAAEPSDQAQRRLLVETRARPAAPPALPAPAGQRADTALRDRIESRMRRALQDYLAGQYQQAAQAVREAGDA